MVVGNELQLLEDGKKDQKDYDVEDQNGVGEAANKNGKRKRRKPRLIVAGEILSYSDVKSSQRVRKVDPSIPRRPKGRPKKYIDASQNVNGEEGVSNDKQIYGESNASVSVSSLSFLS